MRLRQVEQLLHPFAQPHPSQSPRPIAMSACASWYPLSKGSAQGSRKEISRSTMYGLVSAAAAITVAAAPAHSVNLTMGAPARNIMPSAVAHSTAVAPWSGSRSSSAETRTSTASGLSKPGPRGPHFLRPAHEVARQIQDDEQLRELDGCRLNAPNPSHRMLPLTSRPTPGISTSTSSTTAANMRVGPARSQNRIGIRAANAIAPAATARWTDWRQK